MIASTGSKIVSISRIPVSLIVSRIEALIASTASDDCKRLHLKATPMAFTSICHTSAVSEGGMGLFHVGRKSVLLVWPALVQIAEAGHTRGKLARRWS